MKEKIKNFFIFLKDAWVGGVGGKIGIALMIFSAFLFVRIFFGDTTPQSCIKTAIHLNRQEQELKIAKENLAKMKNHVYLLQHPNSSSDYIEEMGLKTLNLGDPDFKELKY